MYDVTVIGGGVVGCAILRELSHTDVKALLLEKEEDVSCGSSRANSGIVHAGYDAEENTLKAKFNVRGNEMYFDLAKELNVPCKRVGSLVLGKKGGKPLIEKLYNRGIKNGVKDLKILERKEILDLEPNVENDIEYALYAPTAGVVSPYEMTVALAEQAVLNGAEVALNSPVTAIERKDGYYRVTVKSGKVYDTKVIINAAGYGSDFINRLAGERDLKLSFKRGDYYIMDSTERVKYNHTCFPLPDDNGKGILVSPTADGNIIVGPTSIPVESGTDTAVSIEALKLIREKSVKMMKGLNFRKGIRVFAGVRCVCGNDFIIENGKNKDFILVSGICSPGLTAAPAIAEYVVRDLLPKTSVKVVKKDKYIIAEQRPVTRNMSKEEWDELVKKDSSYSRIVCRCEKITEGEILAALRSPIPPRSLDALKRRVRTGMGRCQGGFCTPRIMHILSEFYGIPIESVVKSGEGSEVIVGRIKSGSRIEE